MYYQIVDDTMYIGSTKWADDCIEVALYSYWAGTSIITDSTVKYLRMKNTIQDKVSVSYNSDGGYICTMNLPSLVAAYLDKPITNIALKFSTPKLTLLEFSNAPITSDLFIFSDELTTVDLPVIMGGNIDFDCRYLESVNNISGYGSIFVHNNVKMKTLDFSDFVFIPKRRYYRAGDSAELNAKYTFKNCTSLESIKLTISNILSSGKDSLFSGCTALKTAEIFITDVSSSGVNSYMFYGCTSLETVKGNMIFGTCTSMFYNCSSLKTINCSGDWYGSASGSNMFYGCTSLVGGNGTTYDSSKTGISMAVIDQDGQEGYLTYTKNKDLYNVNIYSMLVPLYGTNYDVNSNCLSFEVTDSQHMVAAGTTYNIKQTNTTGTAMVGAVVVDTNGVANVYQGNDITFPVESELNVYIIRDLPNITLNAVIKAIANPQ